jgi:hypothetical protein
VRANAPPVEIQGDTRLCSNAAKGLVLLPGEVTLVERDSAYSACGSMPS